MTLHTFSSITRSMLSLALMAALLVLPLKVYSKTLTISKITNNPAKHSRKMQPFVDHLVQQLADYGYTDGKLVFARDPEQLAKFMRSGKVDMASDTPFAYAKTGLTANIEPIAVRWKNGINFYRSIIFVRSDSDLKTISDLAGKKIAFEDASSTSGFALPINALNAANISLEKLYSPRESTSTDSTTGYIFSGSEQTTAGWVLKGLVDAGAISSLEWYKAQKFLSKNADDLTAIYTSPEVPRALEFVRADLPEDVKQRIKQTLFELHTKPESKYILKKYQKTSLFEPITDDILASLKSIDVIAKKLMLKSL